MKNKYLKLIIFTLFISNILFISNVNAEDNSSYIENNIGIPKIVVTLQVGQKSSIWENPVSEVITEQEYLSEDPKIAYVEDNGEVKAKKVGITTITSKNNKGLKVKVIVYRKMLEPISKIEPRYTLDNDGIYRNHEKGEDENSNRARLMLVGDLMNQSRQQEAAQTEDGTYDFSKSFSIVKNIFSKADYVVGNLESVLSNSAPYMKEQSYDGNRPFCNGPSTYLDALRYAGFDTLVNGNNHMLDDGERGLIETNDVIDKYEFSHTGTFRTKEEPRYVITEVNGIKIAVLSYSEKFNKKDTKLPEEKREIMLNKYSKEKVEKDIKDAKKAGAEFIIVYNHWGREFWNDYTEKQAKHAQEIADAGADLIIGSHPHALQTSDLLTAKDGREVRIMYSMGNFLSHQVSTVAKDTMILNVVLTKDSEGQVKISEIGYIPCHVFAQYNGASYVIVPVSKEFGNNVEEYSAEYYELLNTQDRISAIINNTIPQITSFEQIEN